MVTQAGPPNPAPRPGNRLAKGAVLTGGVLLLVGSCLVTYALTRPAEKVLVAQTDPIGLSLPGATATPTLTAGPTPTPTPTATKKARPKATAEPTGKPAKAGTEDAEPTVKASKKPAPSRAVAGKKYRIRNVITGKCLASMDRGPSTQTECASAGDVLLESTRTVDGVKLYLLRHPDGENLCLDPPGAEAVSSGTALQSWDCIADSSVDNQEFRLKATSRTSQGRVVYTVVNHSSGNCLNVQGWAADKSDRASGAGLSVFTCTDPAWGYDDHLWTFM